MQELRINKIIIINLTKEQDYPLHILKELERKWLRQSWDANIFTEMRGTRQDPKDRERLLRKTYGNHYYLKYHVKHRYHTSIYPSFRFPPYTYS